MVVLNSWTDTWKVPIAPTSGTVNEQLHFGIPSQYILFYVFEDSNSASTDRNSTTYTNCSSYNL